MRIGAVRNATASANVSQPRAVISSAYLAGAAVAAKDANPSTKMPVGAGISEGLQRQNAGFQTTVRMPQMLAQQMGRPQERQTCTGLRGSLVKSAR